MFKVLLAYVKIGLALGAVGLAAAAVVGGYEDERGYRETLMDFMDSHSRKEEVVINVPLRSDLNELSVKESAPLTYSKGDWTKYVLAPRRRIVTEDGQEVLHIEEEEEVNINSYGSMKLNMLYGKSKFRKNSYKQFDEDKPVSRVIQSGFYPERELLLHMEGNVGKRMKIYIDHDSRKKDNHYVMQYRAVRDDEVIREINAGEIDIKLEGSKYAVYDDNSAKGLGIDFTLRKDKLKVKAFGSVTRGETEVETFKGNSSPNYIKLSEYQYIRNTYFQVEPFKRFDNRAPSLPADYANMITFTSAPASAESYIPYAVNLDPSSFELYMDDQNPYNNYSAIQISIDDGYYTRMVAGSDYLINYTTGLIRFLKHVPANARIFAVYTMNGSTASYDPSSRTDVFPGKIFAYLKYGYSIDEDLERNYVYTAAKDRNKDGKLNIDVYEVRSFYRIGEKQILEDNFRVDFYREDTVLTKSEITTFGKFSIDYSNGLIQFNLREPFRQQLGSSLSKLIYSENQTSSAYLNSLFRMRVNYFREARSFQLKHFNIIPDSVRVKVNGRVLSPSLYSVDYTSGFLQFLNSNNPVIGAETDIEVKYEYMPYGNQSQAFIGGIRTDYRVNRYLDVGGTFLFSRESSALAIPKVGSEPEQIMVFEGDAKVRLSPSRLKKMLNSLPGISVRSVPFEVKGYAEYARSYKNINTFGKGLIDDMESTDEIVNISLSDKDWILSSMPQSLAQSVRGKLYYYYYRDPSSAGSLNGTGYGAYAIPYSTKPGPYNVATGHISEGVQSADSQRSLVLDFDFTGGKTCVTTVTRKLSNQAVDFSGLQYMEIWYRGEGGSGTVNLYVDIGKINEDSDGDGLLDTEDQNHNGFLDYDPSAGIFEDKGYQFNPSGGDFTVVGTGPKLNSYTVGDGILNTEDLNGNGYLDTTESVVQLPGPLTNPSAALTLDAGDTTWKMARVYYNKSMTSDETQEILKQVEAVRLYLTYGSATRGKIYIDSIKFVSSRWRNVKIGGVSKEDPTEMKVTVVDTYNDEEYRAESFLLQQRELYKSLHGTRNDEDLAVERESAILLEYSLISASNVSVTRKFVKNMDLRFYKTLNVWMNYRQFNAGDSVAILVGSSESNYIEYRVPMDYTRVWREATLRLKDSSSGNISPYAVVGNPDLKRINYMEIVIRGTQGASQGRIWVNDIYVSEPDTLKDSAYWYRGEINFKRALFYTRSGVPILSDIRIKYITKGHGSQFSTVGKTVNDVSEKFHQIFTSFNILPNWSAQVDFIAETSKTDSLNEEVSDSRRGAANKKSVVVESNYVSNIYAFPSVKVVYKHDNYNNVKEESISNYTMRKRTDDTSHAPVIILEEKLENVLGGNLVTTLVMDSMFREESIKRTSLAGGYINISQYASPEEEEMRQKGNARVSMDYQTKKLYLQPSLDIGSHEIVRLQGRSVLQDTKILSSVEGGYHLPFVYNKDYKFVERNKNTGLKCGLKEIGIFSPGVSLDMYYMENRFRDYETSEKTVAGGFTRAKDARSYISNKFELPIHLDKYQDLKFIRSFVLGYGRSLQMQETEIPYEGEGISAFNEEYGMARVYRGLSPGSLNMLSYHPLYFIQGRGNHGNGRDYVYGTFNEKIAYHDGTPVANYSNAFRLIDNYTLSTVMDFHIFNVNYNAGLNHVAERQIVNGIPLQVMTLSSNLSLSFDLMQIFHSGFFRPNALGIPHHGAVFGVGYNFSRNMLITQNIKEDVQSPEWSLTFKRDRASLGLKFGIDYRYREDEEYISLDDNKRDRRDDIYMINLANRTPFSEIDKGYRFSVFYETDVAWIYRLFSHIYKLKAMPIYSIEYSLMLNRYDYSVTVSPEPYDQHLITSKLTLDLHKNVQGGISGRWALEKFRNRETNGVYREIISYEVGFSFTLLF